MEIEAKSRRLFMKYALPCAGTLVRRGQVSQDEADRLIEAVRNDLPIPEGAEKLFKVAFAACSIRAIDGKRASIDSEVIREYFRSGHDDMIDKRYAEMGDFDPEACRVRPGMVESAGNGHALVVTSQGKKPYRTDFAPGIKVGDSVVVHWNFVVEKIDAETAGKMMEARKALHA